MSPGAGKPAPGCGMVGACAPPAQPAAFTAKETTDAARSSVRGLKELRRASRRGGPLLARGRIRHRRPGQQPGGTGERRFRALRLSSRERQGRPDLPAAAGFRPLPSLLPGQPAPYPHAARRLGQPLLAGARRRRELPVGRAYVDGLRRELRLE